MKRKEDRDTEREREREESCVNVFEKEEKMGERKRGWGRGDGKIIIRNYWKGSKINIRREQ